MISCERFRTRFSPATEDAELLEHIRTCDACLGHAAEIDPDVMFRAIGGDIVPPGGIDAFVDDVMREVRLRSAEEHLAPAPAAWHRRFAIAATMAAVAIGGLFVSNRYESPKVAAPVAHVVRPQVVSPARVSRPVIENYESQSATIVEVPAEGAGDVQVVMIFDENLPKDL